MSNQAQATGDSNIILQDIDSSQINITINDGLSGDVKAKKVALKERIDTLKENIDAARNSDQETATEEAPTKEVRKIVRALKANRCVLFIGPEVAMDPETGRSLHEIKYKSLAEESDGDVIYNEADGFFEPPLGDDLDLDLMDYYRDDFPEENTTGRETLTHLAELPFSLIISCAPDETIKEIFEHFDKSHQYQYYQGHGLEELLPDKDKPLIINALGSILSDSGGFTYSTAGFYKYIMNFKFPAPVKKEIQQASHLLFIGFDLRKWHTKLILFMLEMHNKKDKANRSLLSHIPHEKVKLFLQNQFQVTQIEDEYQRFAEQLASEARKEDIAIPLKQFFYKKQLSRLQKLSIEITDTSEMAVLHEVEKQLITITEKTMQHGK